MPTINLLDSSVYNRIAAGEVVQQPSSVIKELLENCIDAGATDITIEIQDGGIKEITVRDNGCGISKADLKKAFLPHATSKVKTVDDLDSVSTLGFRGEALASIASVSIVYAQSKTADSELGSSISIRGGEFSDIEDSACPNGTAITVKNLFFNTPARAKFLRKSHQEESDVTAVVQRMVFSNPYVSFTYMIDGKLMYKTTGEGLFCAITSIYGIDFSDASIPVDYKKGNITIKGFICKPTFTKPNRNYQTIIINGRYVKDFAFSASIANAFGERLMKRNFPIFVLDVVIPFEDIDVNVHPAKTEVRFKRPTEVYSAAYNAIKNALSEIDSISSLGILSSQSTEILKTHTEQSIFNNSESKPKKDDIISAKKQPSSTLFESFLRFDSPSNDVSLSENKGIDYSLINKLMNQNSDLSNELIKEVKAEQTSFNDDYNFKIIGQAFDCYILIQANENLIILDQHAAHERLIYDELIQKTNTGESASQPLLLPYVRTFSSSEFGRISDVMDELTKLGFEIEEFGRLTIKVSAVPILLTGINFDEFFDGFLSDYDNKADFSYADLLKEKLAMRACRSAIKAGESLSDVQIHSILTQVIKTNMTLQCPHGRPIAIKYTKKDLEKMFKRIV